MYKLTKNERLLAMGHKAFGLAKIRNPNIYSEICENSFAAGYGVAVLDSEAAVAALMVTNTLTILAFLWAVFW
jgi:hypothetical protein